MVTPEFQVRKAVRSMLKAATKLLRSTMLEYGMAKLLYRDLVAELQLRRSLWVALIMAIGNVTVVRSVLFRWIVPTTGSAG